MRSSSVTAWIAACARIGVAWVPEDASADAGTQADNPCLRGVLLTREGEVGCLEYTAIAVGRDGTPRVFFNTAPAVVHATPDGTGVYQRLQYAPIDPGST